MLNCTRDASLIVQISIRLCNTLNGFKEEHSTGFISAAETTEH